MEDEELRSVRVEVDDVAGGAQAPAAPSAERRPMGAVVVVIGGLLLLAAMMIMAVRPAGDEAADGSTRAVPTTAIPTTTEAPVAEDDESEQAHRQIEGVDGTTFSSVIATDAGYFATTWGWSNSQLLYRSVDGTDWTNVEAQFPDEFDQAITNQSLSLAQLRRTADGFSVLAHKHPNNSDDDERGSVSRLVSTDGIEWEKQAEVAMMMGEFGGYPILHTDSIWAYVLKPDDESLLGELLKTNLVDEEILSSTQPCWLDARYEELAYVGLCDNSDPIKLTSADVIDGVSLVQLARCGEALYGLGTNEAAIIDTETGQELRRIVIPQDAPLAGQASTTEALVSVTAAGLRDDDRSSCDGLIDLPRDEHGPVMIWDADSVEGHSISLPDDRADGQFAGWRQAYVRDDSMILIEGGQMWTLDLQPLEWSEATPLFGDGIVSASSTHFVNESGSVVVSVGGNSDIYVTDRETSSTRIIETGLPSRLEWIIYADDDIALIASSSSVYRIDLHAEDPPVLDEN